MVAALLIARVALSRRSVASVVLPEAIDSRRRRTEVRTRERIAILRACRLTL